MPSLLSSTANFNPTIDGTWKNFVTDYGAPTNGSSACDTAVTAYKADPNPRLFIPPGSYNTAGLNTLTNGRSSAIISAYGATFSDLWIGSVGSITQTQGNAARTNSVSAGANSVTLKTGALTSLWSPGDYALMSGLALANTVGYPPTWNYFEFVQIKTSGSGVVTFVDPLIYDYLDTWPDVNISVGSAGTVDFGGPAMLTVLNPQWNTDVTIYGLSCPATIVHTEGRRVFLGNCNFTGSQGSVPSLLHTCVYHGGIIGNQPEVDKLIWHMEYRRCRTTFGVDVQTANNELVLDNFYVPNIISGTFRKNVIQGNSQLLNGMRCGPEGYGATESITAIGNVIGASQTKIADPRCQIANMTWVGGASGTWKISRTSNQASDQFIGCFIPGRKMAFCFFAGSTILTRDSGGTETFTCTAVRDDASFYYADTTIGTTLPTPKFGGNDPNYIINWGSDTNGITQVNSGPADITGFAAP